MELLVEHGGSLDTPDKLWRGTPLGWSMHAGRTETEAWIRERLEPTSHANGWTPAQSMYGQLGTPSTWRVD